MFVKTCGGGHSRVRWTRIGVRDLRSGREVEFRQPDLVRTHANLSFRSLPVNINRWYTHRVQDIKASNKWGQLSTTSITQSSHRRAHDHERTFTVFAKSFLTSSKFISLCFSHKNCTMLSDPRSRTTSRSQQIAFSCFTCGNISRITIHI